MKILHTGDWHIGKLVHGVHMTKDQKYILEQLIELIKDERPDVLVIAGDVYDRSVPPIEAVELLDETLSKVIIDCKTKVIVIAGNHDSPDRVGFASKLLRDNGLYITGNLTKDITPIEIEDEYGVVNFYAVPFSEPAIVKAIFEDETIKNHDSAMQVILDNINVNDRNVCIAHAFVMGTETLETSDSERPLSIGGSEYVNVNYFEKFNYVALGHLHRPQKVKHDYIRYSGSLLKYSFSEAIQKKSVSMIEMDKDGNVEVEYKYLKPIRDLRIIRGKLDDLLDKEVYSLANTDDYIMAILSDRGELIDPIGKLRAIYPNILRLERDQYDREAGQDKTSASNDFLKKNPLELFTEFYENVSGEILTDEKINVMSKVFNDINQKGRIS